MATEGVLFDLDDTLFDHQGTSRAALGELRDRFPALQRLSLDELEVRHVAVLEELHRGVMAGEVSVDDAREERFRRLLGEAAGNAGVAFAGDAAAFYRDAYVRARRPVPGALALLQALRPRVRLGIVSNNVLAEQEDKLEQFGMRPLIDVLVVSAEEGVSKPDPAIFRAALERLGATAADTVMVGDNWMSDVLGAAKVGMRAVWLNRRGEACPNRAMATEIRALAPADAVARVILYGRA
jgi:putative hydrolase of the HAD superfamily